MIMKEQFFELLQDLYLKLEETASYKNLESYLRLQKTADLEVCLKDFEKLIDKFDKKKSRVFHFNDVTKRVLRKGYIIQFRKGIDDSGNPMIILNDFELGLKGDKNPVINLELVYDDVDQRDKDLEDLEFCIK